jgi:hypothetical protein
MPRTFFARSLRKGVEMATRILVGAVLAGVTLSFAACQSQSPQQSENQTPAASAPAADASHEGHTGGRVYFVEPKDGATLSSKAPVKFVFGSDNYTIAAVPPGEIKPEQVRPNMGHFHLGVDKDCLPAGETIVKGTPDWIHFGDGKNEIEMQLKPGKHTFAVEVGDDLHRAVEGLCQTITVTVE